MLFIYPEAVGVSLGWGAFIIYEYTWDAQRFFSCEVVVLDLYATMIASPF